VDAVRRIADAVLYEGYVLWPYTRSALKNRQRWTFGGVYPRGHSEPRGGDDPWEMRAQVLVEGDRAARVEVGVRFLHIVWRQVHDEAGLPVDDRVVDGERLLTWEEATERQVAVPAATLEDLGEGVRVAVDVPAGRESDGPVTRSWEALEGIVELRAERLGPGLHRVALRVANTTPWAGGPREAALRRTLCSTHAVLRVDGGGFVSLTDPPEALRAATEACENQGVWPVLVGEAPARDTLLASPIILPDYPEIAPESPGDLFDGGEIDQLLSLSILGLTDAEKDEMRASDPRTREILERTERLTPEELMRLHGTFRDRALERRP
jgi:hypothetical protein